MTKNFFSALLSQIISQTSLQEEENLNIIELTSNDYIAGNGSF